MLTSDMRFIEIVEALIRERIEGISESVMAGQLPDHAAYKGETGRIRGLEEALQLLADAQTKLNKER